MWSPVGVDGSGILNPLGQAAVQAMVRDSVGPQVELADAIEKSKLAAASKMAYGQAVASAEIARRGRTVLTCDMEDPTQVTTNYGSWIRVDATLAHSGTRYYVLPYNNTNTANPKPVHGYVNTDLVVTAGRKYAFRVYLRSIGDMTGAQIAFLIGKPVNNAAQYWQVTAYSNLTAKGITTDDWTEFEVQWIATETATIRVGMSARSLVTNLLADDVQVADITDVSDQSGLVAAARATMDADAQAAVTAWQLIMPAGAVSGGSNVRTLTRAEYDALTPEQKTDPEITYLVTV